MKTKFLLLNRLLSQINLLILALFILASPSYAKSQLYTLEDLTILHEQKSYREYLDHFLDIRPTLRNKQWKEMTTDVADSYIKQLINKNLINEENFLLIEKLAQQVTLKNYEFFQLRRTQYAAKYFKQCFTTEKCIEQFKRYYSDSKVYEDFDYVFYTLFKDTWPESKALILPRLSLSKVSSFFCKKPQLAKDLAIYLYLKIPQKQLGHKLNDRKGKDNLIGQYANIECLKEVKGQLYKEVLRKYDPKLKQFLYSIFKESHLLTQEEDDLLLITYILQGPIKGDVLNLAWNRVEKVSQNYKRRKKLLENLLSLDPLPDLIFSESTGKERLVFIKHIQKYFPEYIEKYAKTCVSYLKGTGSFPFGNPTVECDSLMQMASQNSWIQDEVYIQYSSSKRFTPKSTNKK